jgi:hypothetical protein
MIERETRTEGQPEGILRNRRGICDKMWPCEPNSDFCEKLGANYAAPAVQFPPASNWIGIILWFSEDMPKNLFT